MLFRDTLDSLVFLTIVLLLVTSMSCGQKNSSQPGPKTQAQEDANKVKVVVETVKAAKTLEVAGAEKGSVLQRLGYERRLKGVLDKIQFVVSIKVGKSFICTGFFVDKRGYILTAKHCIDDLSSDSKTTFIFMDGKEHPARFVEEIQTLDLVLFSSDEAVDFSVAEFLDPLETTVSDKNSPSKEEKNLDKKIVITPCSVKNDGSARAKRIYLSEILSWDSDKKISLLQPQRDIAGCSGAPIIGLDGKVIAVLRSRSGDLIYGVPVFGLKDAISAMINGDLARTVKK